MSSHTETFSRLSFDQQIEIIHYWLQRIAEDDAFVATRPLIARAIAPALQSLSGDIDLVRTSFRKEIDDLRAAVARLEAGKAVKLPVVSPALSQQMLGYERLRWRQAFAEFTPGAPLPNNATVIATTGVTNP